MTSTLRKIIFATLACTALSLTGISLQARAPKIEIVTGGYDFYTSYKVHSLSSLGIKPSNLVVNVISGPMMSIAKRIDGKVAAGAFRTKLNFFVDHIPAKLETQYFGEKKKEILSVNIKPSSEWYPGIKKVREKVLDKYYPAFKPKKKKQQPVKEKKSRSSSPFRVKALKGSKLNSIYSLHIKSPLAAKSPLSPRVIVAVTTNVEALENYHNKKMLTMTATFCTKKGATLDSPLSRIKFVITKKGIREIERKNVPTSSIWYPWVKRVCHRSAKKFTKLNEIHTKMLDKKKARSKRR
jgi:hypothetical protein